MATHQCFGGSIYTIQCGGQRVTFEMHRVCGPVPLRASDLQERTMSPNHRFWQGVSQWAETGGRVDAHGRCVIGDRVPPKMVRRDDKEFYIAPAAGWTCFHCGETFLTADGARQHFGTKPDAVRPNSQRDR